MYDLRRTASSELSSFDVLPFVLLSIFLRPGISLMLVLCWFLITQLALVTLWTSLTRASAAWLASLRPSGLSWNWASILLSDVMGTGSFGCGMYVLSRRMASSAIFTLGWKNGAGGAPTLSMYTLIWETLFAIVLGHLIVTVMYST